MTSSLSRNSSSRDHLSYFQQKIYLNFKLPFMSTPNSLSRFNNLIFQGQAGYAINNPDTLSTTTPSTVNKLVSPKMLLSIDNSFTIHEELTDIIVCFKSVLPGSLSFLAGFLFKQYNSWTTTVTSSALNDRHL